MREISQQRHSRTAGPARRALAGLLATLASFAAGAAPLAYVPNEGSSTVSVIDTASDAVVGEIATGGKPRGFVVGADGTTGFVAEQPDLLGVVDVVGKRMIRSLAICASPDGLGISRNGLLVAVACQGSNQVVFFDVTSQTLAFAVPVRGKNPEHAEFAPDGRFVFVSAEDGQTVDVIDVTRRAQIAQIPVGARPRSIAFSPDSLRAFVAAEGSNELYVIDAVGFKVLARIKVGSDSNGVLMGPNGGRLYVSNGGDGTVSVIDIPTQLVLATIPVRQGPSNMAITPDGRKLYVACGRSGTVSVIDTESNTRLAEIAVGKLPWGVAMGADRRTIAPAR